jgi:tetratricopeptide (TPR) repeat protein
MVSRGGSATASAFLGRRESLQRLVEAFESEVRAGRPAVVTVTGEAGIGKTAFLFEAEAELRRSFGGVRVAYGRALAQHSTANGFQPIREAIADLVFEEERTGGAGALRRLAKGFRETAPDWLEAVPVVGQALAAATRTAAAVHRQGDLRRGPDNSLTRQFCDLVISLVDAGPFVLMLDDLHWADASTVDLIYSLTQIVTSGPLLLVCAYRPADLQAEARDGAPHPLLETVFRIERYGGLVLIDLARLSRRDVEALVEATLGRQLPDAFHAELHTLTGGNPLFAHEYLGLLLDDLGRDAAGEEFAQALRRAVDRVPRRVEAVIAERLLRLDDAERRTLDVASVLGPVFSPEDLLAVIDIDRAAARRALRSLCRRHAVIVPVDRGGRAPGYAFHHITVAQVLAAQLKGSDPYDYQEIHRAIAEMIASGGSRALSDLERLAQHSYESGDREAALRAAVDAADAAWRMGAVTESMRVLERATEPLDHNWADIDSLATALCVRLRAHNAIGDHAGAVRLAEAAARLPVLAGRLPVRARLEQAFGLRMLNRWDDGRAVLSALLAEQLSDGERAEALMLLGQIELCGLPPSASVAIDAFERALELTEDPELVYRTEGHLGLCHLASYDPGTAFGYLRRAIVTAEAADHPWHVYDSRHWLSKAEIACLRLEDALASLEMLDQVTASTGVASTLPFHLRDRARVLALSGRISQSCAAYARYLESVAALLDATQWQRALATLGCQILELGPTPGLSAGRDLGDAPARLAAGLDAELGHATLGSEAAAQARAVLREALKAPDAPSLRDALARAVSVPPPVFDAAEAIYRFDVPDLAALRALPELKR